jgi:large subunit ribosomal protein L3
MSLQGIIGKKLYQSSGFLEDGTRVPLTAVVTKGNFVSQIKTTEKEGYNSLQLGFGTKKRPLKREINHGKKAGLTQTPRFFREFKGEELAGELGQEILAADVFKPGDIIDVTGVSKGKGYAGVVKRHHFKGGPRTHGQSDRERAPGSIGQTTTPGRVYKGKRMAGRMGHTQATVKNLEIIEITDDGVVLVKGLIPGAVNTIVSVKKTGENKKFVPLYKPASAEASSEAKEIKEEPQETTAQEEVQALTEEISAHVAEETPVVAAAEDVSIPTETQVTAEVKESEAPVVEQSVNEVKEEVKEEVSADAKAVADKQENAS